MSYANDDYNLGFTKQTAMILEGLGAVDAVSQFRKRNISTHALSELSEEDLITLGIEQHLARNMVKQLSSRVKKQHFPKPNSSQNKTAQLTEISKNGNKHLSLIQSFIQYTQLKLGQKPVEYIIDVDNNMRASEALIITTKCTIQEVNNLREQLQQLLRCVCKTNDKMKKSSKRMSTIVGGVSFTIVLICTWRFVSSSMIHR